MTALARGLLMLLMASLCSHASAFCFAEASKRYSVDESLLRAIAQNESAMNPAAVNVNKDKSVDIGLMQINSRHLPALAQYGITRSDLFDPCTSLNIGAWILAESIARYGANWRAVGAYNAGTRKDREENRRIYATKISAILAHPSTAKRQLVHAPAAVASRPTMQVYE